MNSANDIAILLFSRSAKLESHFKRWTDNPSINFHIADQLIKKSLAKLCDAPFPLFHIDETLQTGNTFGQRFSNAFNFIFNKGYKYVVALGNDCNDVRPDWQLIYEQLKSRKSILGPDRRGGVYLIGISKEAFFDLEFGRISWKSPLVFRQLKCQLDHCYILRAEKDTNTFDDVVENKDLLEWIRRYRIKPIFARKKEKYISTPQIPQGLKRGPPSYALTLTID